MKTLLLIDDDEAFRSLLTEMLQSAGWEVWEAEDGDSGLALALSRKPAVVLCDLLMPRVNGFQVCRAIRARKDTLPHTRIVVTSGSSYPADRLGAFDAGADEFITKPISPGVLFDVLERLGSQAAAIGLAAEGDMGIDAGASFRFWGVRGSIPTPSPDTVFFGGNTSCVEVRADGELIVLDGGSGIRALGNALRSEFQHKAVRMSLLITHTHWDHIQGFPFFAPAYNPHNQIKIMAFEGARKGFEATLSSQMESPYFPISMQQMPGNLAVFELKELEFHIGKVRITAAFMNHPGICVGYRLHTSSGSIVYMPDNELARPRQSGALNANEIAAWARTENGPFFEFIKGADVAIMDAQYTVAEYAEKVGWGHSCVDDTVELAMEAGVKELYLFHHDPDHTDQFLMEVLDQARELVERRGKPMTVHCAREGIQIRLGQGG